MKLASNIIGRPVRVASISFTPGEQTLASIARLVDQEGAHGVDIIALPETWNDQKKEQPETLEGPTVKTLAELARKHRTYIVCPIDRMGDSGRLNSALLIDRLGHIVMIYDKAYPYWSEFDRRPPVQVADFDVPVYETDFGNVGMAICFDVNFPEVWQRLADQDAELVIWSSAYSGGRSLQAHAINHHYYIVTSTYNRDCIVYDITGEEILYECRDNGVNISRFTLDLDRGIYHENFNVDKLNRLLAEHGDEVELEQWLHREQWFVLRAKRPGICVRQLARQYGLEELRAYKYRSQQEIDRMRKVTATAIST
ncbi:MAG: hypothetical protein KatS3mg050_0502 [Litorilinea sp.]|nr:MAG: hypothetical protein KatS3mg050_0502 [Litorilinea sp.]